uniref:Putative secreted protein n=1 Tax=Anopheles marajoara TaxID=58244 RepID=A0A2M4CEM1_9DIPT
MNTSSQALSFMSLAPLILSEVIDTRASFASIKPCERRPMVCAIFRFIGISSTAKNTPAVNATPSWVYSR